MINKLKVYGIQFKKLGLATFWGGIAAFRRLLLSGWVATFRGVSTFRGVTTFGGLLLLGCTSSHKKLTLISGGALLGGGSLP